MTNETKAATFQGAPGPWREYDRNDIGDIYLCDATGSAVSIVLQASIPAVAGRTEANAHLIEAAPDLLAALSALLGDPADGWRVMGAASAVLGVENMKRARTAITKALA